MKNMISEEYDKHQCQKSTFSIGWISLMDYIGYAMASGIIIFALWIWFTLPPIIYQETESPRYIEANTKIEGHFLSPGNILSHTFDLKAHEAPPNAYRPRAGSFLIDYLDMNMAILIREKIPGWGSRYTFYILATLMLPFIFYLLFKKIMADDIIATDLSGNAKLRRQNIGGGGGILAAISAIPVLFCNYSASMSLQLRSAKLLAPSFCLFIFYVFLSFLKTNPSRSWKGKNWTYVVGLSILVFFLMLFDETVIAAAVFFGIASFCLSIRTKKYSTSALILHGAMLLYASYYLLWGHLLFQHYTQLPLIRHVHNFDDVMRMNISILFQTFEVLYDPFSSNPLFFLTALIIFTVGLPALLRKRKFEAALLSCLCLFFSIAVAAAQLCSHNVLYEAKHWHYGMYFLPSTMFFYMTTCYIFLEIIRSKKITGKKRCIYMTVTLAAVMIIGLYDAANIQNYYHRF